MLKLLTVNYENSIQKITLYSLISHKIRDEETYFILQKPLIKRITHINRFILETKS